MPAKLRGSLAERCDRANDRIEKIVTVAVYRIEAGAKRRARVDTGAMRAGLQGRKTGRHDGRVEGLVAHTIYNELGTVDMAAQPMLVPAAEDERPSFYRALSKAWD